MKRLMLVPALLAIASLTAYYEEKQADVVVVPVGVPVADPVVVVPPAGEKGDTGDTGNTGAQGAEGEQGVDGSDR
ncbi:MAG: hypothetical protein ACREO1_01110 [Arenimonas sp.]